MLLVVIRRQYSTKLCSPVLQDTAFVTEQILHHIIIFKMPVVNYRSSTWFSHYKFLFQMREYYSVIFRFSIFISRQDKKGRWIHMQMAKIKKSTQGRGMHAPIGMLKCFSKLHHHLNITLKAPLEHHLCALHCKK